MVDKDDHPCNGCTFFAGYKDIISSISPMGDALGVKSKTAVPVCSRTGDDILTFARCRHWGGRQ